MTDLAQLALAALRAHRLRSSLSMFGIAIGIASVILLTSIGEGTRDYVLDQFTQFGTNLVAINPGKSKTLGVPGVLGGTTHKLTIDDSEALARLPFIEHAIPIAMGMARVESGERGRSVYIYGTTPDLKHVWKFNPRTGSFWSESDPRRDIPLTVLGPRVARELFPGVNPLGRFVRIADARFRVVGVMEPKGQMLGFDLDDSAYIPVASAMRIFNLDELFEIDVIYSEDVQSTEVEAAVKSVLIERHAGNEDFEVTTQDAMLEVSSNVLRVITIAVGAIAGISLIVGATGILTMMWITVGERTSEIGLIRSLGATTGQVQLLFLIEAATLATFGGALGVVTGLSVCALLRALVPGLPVQTPTEFVVAALAVSFVTGLASGALPARRAARLDPIESLRAE
jgi:putative ABC transport system permease protein